MAQSPEHIACQERLRCAVVPTLSHVLRLALQQAYGDAEPFVIKLYGSLQHRLYVPGYSKICLDVTRFAAQGDGTGPRDVSLLHTLAAELQQRCPAATITHPVNGGPHRCVCRVYRAGAGCVFGGWGLLAVGPPQELIWNRTVDRPLLLAFFWDGLTVHVTTGNQAGLRVSCAMERVLADDALLHMTLFRWKDHLRRRTDLLGPNLGQVSTYALFLLLRQCAGVLQQNCGWSMYAHCARLIASAFLGTAGQPPRICDRDGVNVTARSYHAQRLALELLRMPQCC